MMRASSGPGSAEPDAGPESTDGGHGAGAPAGTPAQSGAEALLLRCLQAMEEPGHGPVEALLAQAPEDAAFVRSCLGRLGELGLATGPRAATSLPARIAEHDVLCRLGGGAMGAVFLVREPGTHRLAALKTLRADLRGTVDGPARFAREVAAIARLAHPGIVPLFRAGEAEGIPFFTMEWVLGASLAQVVRVLSARAPGQLRGPDLLAAVRGTIGAADPVQPAQTAPGGYVAQCLELVLQAAQALAHAHARGVLHRDIKSSNLLVDVSGRVRVVDFGLAQADGTSRLTVTGAQVGSLPYLAPELLAGRAPHDVRSEVYALGVVLFELLALRLPFAGEHAEALRQAIQSGQPVPLRVLQPQVGEAVETVCLKALAPEPERRYPDMTAFAADLHALLAGQPVVARRPGAWLQLRRLVARRPALATGLLLGALLVLLLPTLWALLQAQHAERVVELTDPFLARALLEEQRRLWPAVVDRVPAMQSWLEQTGRLLERWPQHQQRLTGLQARAVSHAPAAAPAHRLRGAQVEEFLAELARSRSYAERFLGVTYPEYRKVLDPLLDDLTFEQHAVLPFALPSLDEQREFDHLVVLLRDLEQLASLVPAVHARIAQAQALVPLSLDAHAASWQAACAAIAASSCYRGLQLAPVVGLVPLGPDPESGLWEFAHLPSGPPATRDPATGRLRLAAEHGLVLVLLPGGRTRMGAVRPGGAGEPGPHEDPWCGEDEGPVVDRELAPFFLSKFEMTQAQWLRVVGTNPSRAGVGTTWHGNPARVTAQHPVEGFTWFEGYEVARRLGLTLPTEAQWEYAARAGTSSVWFWGNQGEAAAAFANLAGEELGGDGWLTHAPVGSLRPNAFGLHDMIGNVAEWCLDAWDRYQAVDPAPGDGRWTARLDSGRNLRGGSAAEGVRHGRCAFRACRDPFNREVAGIRPVLMLPRAGR